MLAMLGSAVVSGACRGLERGDPFDPNQKFRYSVQLDEPEDWETLRYEGRSLGILGGQCDAFPGYSRFRSVVDVAGVRFRNVETRKKGKLGSLSAEHPSLKLDFGQDQEDRGRRFRGERWVTLNNNQQDPSHVRQCLALGVFRAAGLPAPRCNLAEVVVHGEPKGPYTHVESIKGPLLRREFGDDTGALFEADSSDFGDITGLLFERKDDDVGQTGHAAIEAVTAALAGPTEGLYERLDQLIDMDQFLTFSAVEVLVGHVDGYTSSQNNVYVYVDPSDDRLRFIPWGLDQTFRPDLPNDGRTYPVSVFLESELFFHLWPDPAFQARYDERMREMLDSVWDEAQLEAEARRWSELAGDGERYLGEVLTYIDGRRAAVEADLGTPRSWPVNPRRTVPQHLREDCRTLEDFVATFGGLAEGLGENDFEGTFQVNFRYDDADVQVRSDPGSFNSAIEAGVDVEGDVQPRDAVVLRMWRETGGDTRWFSFVLPLAQMRQGVHPMHGFESFGLFGTNDEGTLGLVGDGYIEFDRVDPTPGSRIAGRIVGKVVP